ncbi:MAG: hypothetical protein WCC58_04955 [Burkholderiales bacterium]
MKKVIFAALCLLVSAGCVTPAGDNVIAAEEKEYTTGSNIPRKDRTATGVRTVDPAEIEKIRNSVPAAVPRSN